MSEFPTLSEVTKDVVRIRKDGSFVTTYNGNYYYIPAPGKMGKLYMELAEWAKEHETMPEEEYEAQKEVARKNAFFNDLPTAKEVIVNQINSYVANKIYGGFDYVIDGGKYHFAYDAIDQQNFADTMNAILLSKSTGADIPAQSVMWNGYKADGTLVQFELKPESFIGLYSGGALTHKATCMAEAGAMKAAVRDATDGDTLKAVVKSFPFAVEV